MSRDLLKIWLLSFLLVFTSSEASAEPSQQSCAQEADIEFVINNWSLAAEAVVRAKAMKAPEAARLYALNSIALHDGYMATVSKSGYMVTSEAHFSEASIPQILADASFTLIASEYPDAKPVLDIYYKKQFCQKTLTLDTSFGTNIGLKISKLAPRLVLSGREGNHTGNAGEWVLTPPAFQAPVLPDWGSSKPLALLSAAQFRPSGPPDLKSKIYADALFNVKIFGKHGRALRFPEEAKIARFWANGHRTATGPGHWNQIARQVTTNLDPSEKLNILMIMNIAMYDAGIAAWDAKYAYAFWRPITAIRKADMDENEKTKLSDNWFPYLKNPYHPEYVSGHSTFSAAAATVLNAKMGAIPFCATSEGVSIDTTRCFNTFWEAAEEAGMSRIYGGIHFSFSNKAGLELGRNIGNWTMQKVENAPATYEFQVTN